MGKQWLAAITLVLCAACGAPQAQELTDADRSAIASSVEAQVRLFAEGASQLDPAVQEATMAANVEFVDFARVLEGRQASTEWATELFSRYSTFEMVWNEVEVEVLSPDAALATAVGSLTRQHVDGRVQESDRQIFFTAIYQLRGSEWLLTRGHLSGSIQTSDQP